MLIVSYDISDTKTRTKLSKFLEKFGFRLQYSVFQINNSERILKNIMTEIDNKFSKRFTESDSVILFHMSETCKITRYGYAKHNEDDFLLIS